LALKVGELKLACWHLVCFYVSDALLIIGLPDGPTAHFKLSKLVLRKDIKVHVVQCSISSYLLLSVL
jgi:hypothetical protein